MMKASDLSQDQCQSFQIGTVVLNKLNNQTYVITNTVGGTPVATRTISIFNTVEWKIIAEPKEENYGMV